MSWVWVPPHVAIAWHTRLIESFGGAPGLRDIGLLESALDRPKNAVAYGEGITVEKLAAIYAVGLAKAHAFTDGNKRIAFAVMAAFLKVNGRRLDVSDAEATAVMLQVAEGTIVEDELTKWLIQHCHHQ